MKIRASQKSGSIGVVIRVLRCNVCMLLTDPSVWNGRFGHEISGENLEDDDGERRERLRLQLRARYGGDEDHPHATAQVEQQKHEPHVEKLRGEETAAQTAQRIDQQQEDEQLDDGARNARQHERQVVSDTAKVASGGLVVVHLSLLHHLRNQVNHALCTASKRNRARQEEWLAAAEEHSQHARCSCGRTMDANVTMM